MSVTERMKLSHKLRAPTDEVDILPGLHYTLLRGVKSVDKYCVQTLDK